MVSTTHLVAVLVFVVVLVLYLVLVLVPVYETVVGAFSIVMSIPIPKLRTVGEGQYTLVTYGTKLYSGTG